MTLYYYQNKWHISSSSKPDASGLVPDKSSTLADVFWNQWTKLKYKLPDPELNNCYMFEMVSKKQPTHISYDEDGIFLHGARNLQTHQLLNPIAIADLYGWTCVKKIDIDSNIEAAISFVNNRSAKNYEGIIVSDANFNMIKLKSSEYVALVYVLSCYRTKPELARKKSTNY